MEKIGISHHSKRNKIHGWVNKSYFLTQGVKNKFLILIISFHDLEWGRCVNLIWSRTDFNKDFVMWYDIGMVELSHSWLTFRLDHPINLTWGRNGVVLLGCFNVILPDIGLILSKMGSLITRLCYVCQNWDMREGNNMAVTSTMTCKIGLITLYSLESMHYQLSIIFLWAVDFYFKSH